MSDLLLILLVALPLALLFLAVGRRMRRRTRTWVEVSAMDAYTAWSRGKRLIQTGDRLRTRYWVLD